MPGPSRSAKQHAYRGDGGAYARGRQAVLAGNPPCIHRGPTCAGTATEADHVPPLALHRHEPGTGCCLLVPSCGPCARSQGGRLGAALGGAVVSPVDLEDVAEPDPVPMSAFDVPWLADLLDVPPDATWPRSMIHASTSAPSRPMVATSRRPPSV